MEACSKSDVYFRKAVNPFIMHVLQSYKSMDKLQFTGRQYNLFDYVMHLMKK
jgi:hypothetical protein